LLSVYLDGELPSPWREKLESHLSGCPECAGRVEAYGRLSPAPMPGGGEAEAAAERVWRRLSAPAAGGGRRARRGAIWGRSVSLPLPAAAAAAAVLVAGLAFAWALASPGPGAGQGATLISSEAEFGLPVDGIESVIEYLIGRSGSDVLMMRLPDDQSFVSSGESAVILAADYSRQIASWGAQPQRGRN